MMEIGDDIKVMNKVHVVQVMPICLQTTAIQFKISAESYKMFKR